MNHTNFRRIILIFHRVNHRCCFSMHGIQMGFSPNWFIRDSITFSPQTEHGIESRILAGSGSGIGQFPRMSSKIYLLFLLQFEILFLSKNFWSIFMQNLFPALLHLIQFFDDFRCQRCRLVFHGLTGQFAQSVPESFLARLFPLVIDHALEQLRVPHVFEMV